MQSIPQESTPSPQPASPAPAGKAHAGSLEALLAALAAEELPILAASLEALREAVDADPGAIAAIVLRDFGLAGKLLRAVNSAAYSQFGGTIDTVSRAVTIVGADAVRKLAESLPVLERIEDAEKLQRLESELAEIRFAALLGQRLAAHSHAGSAEDGALCAMHRRLGRLLIAYGPRAGDPALGVSAEHLAIAMARAWRLPERIAASMRELHAEELARGAAGLDKLRLVAELAAALARAPEPAGARTLEQPLVKRLAALLGLAPAALGELVAAACEEFCQEAEALFGEVPGRAAAARLRERLDLARGALEAGDGTLIRATALLHRRRAAAAPASLAAGVEKVTSALTGEFNMNEVLSSALEAIHRGAGFERVLFCTRDPRSGVFSGRFGLGPGVSGVAKAFAAAPAAGQDIFHIALEKNLDLLVEDLGAEAVRDYIPSWYREAVQPACFLLLPLAVQRRPIGLIYADAGPTLAPALDHDSLCLLRSLRNHMILCMRGRH